MTAQAVELKTAVGKLLCTPIFHASGKKLLAKGHQISEEDVQLLDSAGHDEVWVAVLEEGEVPEDEAASRVAGEAACGSLEIRVAAGGRANLFATENSCLLVDEVLLRGVNRLGRITVATAPNFSFIVAGQRAASVKTTPFAVSRKDFEESLSLVSEQGPVLQARPIGSPSVAVLYSDPIHRDRGRQLFEGIMRTRLERMGVRASFVLSTIEEEMAVARCLEHLLRARPTAILVASTVAPAGPEDVVGRAMSRVGCRMESFLAPVEPGNLLLLCYAGEIPVVAAPGCFRSPRANVVDLVLPPLLARYPLTAAEISTLGHGGLLQ